MGRDFYSFTPADLESFVVQDLRMPAYRARQLLRWVYQRGVCDIESMTDIGKATRAELKEIFDFQPLLRREVRHSTDGSRKYLFEVGCGDLIESVLIKQRARLTLCVSSQVGCAMGCTFCRTGTMGLKRHLSASEMVRQVTAALDDGRRDGALFQNIVFMGMGEPLHNIGELVRAIHLLKCQYGLAISGRRITVSTSGYLPGLAKLAAANLDVNLAVSINAATDLVRSQLMPINRAYPLADLLSSLKGYPLKPRRRITIEYVLIAGVNDSPEDCKRLLGLLRGLRVKINLIPYNETSGASFHAPESVRLEEWQDYLLKGGVETTIRWSRGADILAACGQLASTSVALHRKEELPLSSGSGNVH